RGHAPPADVVCEGRHRQLLRDLRLADERAGAAPAHEVALPHEFVERGAYRQPRHAEIRAELALRGDRLAGLEALDHVEHALAGRVLLRHDAACSAGSRCGVSTRAALPERMLAPVVGSKKWKRDGSTAR